MVEQDRGDKRGSQVGTDWFIDFEQDDLSAELVRPQARRRPGQSGASKPKSDPQPRTTGPSPWVADFLLNQVEGSRIEPTVRRKPAPDKGGREMKRSTPSQHERPPNGTAEARGPATTPEHVANGRVEAPRPTSHAIPPSLSPTTGSTGPGGNRGRPYALAATLALGLATGLWTFPQGSWRNTHFDEADTRSAGTATIAPQPDGTSEPHEVRRALPLQAAAILQPPRVIPVLSSPAPSPVGYRETIEVASLAGEPPVTSFEPASASMEVASLPIQAAWIVRPPGQAATPIGAAVEVTARDVDEKHVVVARPASAEDYGPGAQANAGNRPVTPAPEAIPIAKKGPTATVKGPQGNNLRQQLHTTRRNDMRRQAVRPSSAQVAQATQPRSFALPAVLRPTSF